MTGCQGRKPNIIRSLLLGEGALEELNLTLQKKYQVIQKKEQLWEDLFLDDAGIILVAYGSMARIAKSIVRQLRKQRKKIGLIRPISLWPFPNKIFQGISAKLKKTKFLVIEMSYGQMVEDVRLAINGKFRVEFLGRAGGGIPAPQQIIRKINSMH